MEQAEQALTSLVGKTTSWCGKEEDEGGLAQVREGGGGSGRGREVYQCKNGVESSSSRNRKW
jgi:hypothetical protein